MKGKRRKGLKCGGEYKSSRRRRWRKWLSIKRKRNKRNKKKKEEEEKIIIIKQLTAELGVIASCGNTPLSLGTTLINSSHDSFANRFILLAFDASPERNPARFTLVLVSFDSSRSVLPESVLRSSDSDFAAWRSGDSAEGAEDEFGSIFENGEIRNL